MKATPDTSARPLTSLQNRRTQLKQISQGSQRPQTSNSAAAAGNSSNYNLQDSKEDSDLNVRYNSSANFKKINYKPNQQDDIDNGFSNNQGHQSMISLSQSVRMPQIKNEFSLKDMSKTIPKNIFSDKERLYEDLIHSKQMVNQLKGTNYRLQTQVHTLKLEIRRYEQLAEMNDQNASMVASPAKKSASQKLNPYSASVAESSSIVPSLKKQVVELTAQLTSKEKEITEIKRNVKLTKISELEVELKQYMDETIRLRRLLQQALNLRNPSDEEGDSTTEEKFLGLKNQINSLKSDLAKAQEQNNLLSNELAESNKQIKDISRQSQKQAKDKSAYKRMLVEKERELEKYEDAGLLGQSSHRRGGAGVATEGEFKVELERKIIECNTLSTRCQDRERKLYELEAKMKDLKADSQEKLNAEIKEKEALKAKSEKDMANFKELEDKYNQLFSLKPSKERRTDTAKTNQGKSQYIDFTGQETPQQLQKSDYAWTPSNNNNASRKKLTNNEMNLVHTLAAEIRAKLRYKQIPFSLIHTYLFTNDILERESATFEELKEALQNDPFSVTNEEDLNLFCTYLIDEQSQSQPSFNMHGSSIQSSEEGRFNQAVEDQQSRVNKTSTIECTFKKCIGFYSIFDKQSHLEHFYELQRFVNEKEKSLRGQFTSGLLVDKKQFEKFVKTSDFVLDSALLDFVSQVSFESKQLTNSIDLEKIFKFFGSQKSSQYSSLRGSDSVKQIVSPNNRSNKDSIQENFNQHKNNNFSSNSPSEKSEKSNNLDRKLTDLKKLHSQDENSNQGSATHPSYGCGSSSNATYQNNAAKSYLGPPKNSNDAAHGDDDEKTGSKDRRAMKSANVEEYDDDNASEERASPRDEEQTYHARVPGSKKNSLMPKIDEEEDLSSPYKKAQSQQGAGDSDID